MSNVWEVLFNQDAGDKGYLSREDLFPAMIFDGYPEETLQKMFAEIDTDGNGKVDKTEFIKYQDKMNNTDYFRAYTMEDLCRKWDKNRDGMICRIELQKILSTVLEKDVSEEEAKSYYDGCDTNNDGQVSYKELMAKLFKGGKQE